MQHSRWTQRWWGADPPSAGQFRAQSSRMAVFSEEKAHIMVPGHGHALAMTAASLDRSLHVLTANPTALHSFCDVVAAGTCYVRRLQHVAAAAF